LKQHKSQGKAVEVTLNSKEENPKTFFWISSKIFGLCTGYYTTLIDMTNFRGSRIRFEQLGLAAEPAPNMDTLDNFMARNNHTAINYLKVGPALPRDIPPLVLQFLKVSG